LAIRGWRVSQISGQFRCQTVEGFRIDADAGDTIGMHLYYWSTWESNEAHVIKKILRPGNCFLDVGANVGFFTLLASRIVGRTGHVIAIEATPETARCLLANLELNDATNVVVQQLAVADRKGVVSLNRRWAKNQGSNQISLELLEGGETVECCTLDELVGDQKVDFIKMDIEGAELLAVRGMTRLLSKPNAPDVLIEVTAGWIPEFGGDVDELLDTFERDGYGVMRVGDRRLETVDRDQIRKADQILLFFSKRLPEISRYWS
jgi:FkbM family methyltransferase